MKRDQEGANRVKRGQGVQVISTRTKSSMVKGVLCQVGLSWTKCGHKGSGGVRKGQVGSRVEKLG